MIASISDMSLLEAIAQLARLTKSVEACVATSRTSRLHFAGA
jgi:hypothetical protein